MNWLERGILWLVFVPTRTTNGTLIKWLGRSTDNLNMAVSFLEKLSHTKCITQMWETLSQPQIVSYVSKIEPNMYKNVVVLNFVIPLHKHTHLFDIWSAYQLLHKFQNKIYTVLIVWFVLYNDCMMKTESSWTHIYLSPTSAFSEGSDRYSWIDFAHTILASHDFYKVCKFTILYDGWIFFNPICFKLNLTYFKQNQKCSKHYYIL